MTSAISHRNRCLVVNNHEQEIEPKKLKLIKKAMWLSTWPVIGAPLFNLANLYPIFHGNAFSMSPEEVFVRTLGHFGNHVCIVICQKKFRELIDREFKSDPSNEDFLKDTLATSRTASKAHRVVQPLLHLLFLGLMLYAWGSRLAIALLP